MPTDKKISELPVAASVNASDISVLVNNDTDYQYTFTLLLQFLQANLVTGANISFGITLPQNTSGKNGDVFVNTAAGSFAQKVSGSWTVVYTLPAASAADGTLLYGAGLPAASTGKNLDSYINTLNGIFYKKSADVWSQVFSMATGPQGPQGTAGVNGINGADGNTILFGAINPSNSTTGVNGNFYINTSNYTLFGPKAVGIWGDGVSLLGVGLPNGGSTGQMLVKADGTDYNAAWEDNSFASLTGNPADNANLSTALSAKQDSLGYTPENIAAKNQANGYPGLDGSGKVAAAQLPSYIDDVLEFANYTALPASGETGKIYITLNDNAEYRWSGSTYIQLVASPGSTDAVPEGSINKYFTVAKVLATVLTGIGFSSPTAVLATDTILQAIGKLQAQITGLLKIPIGGTTGQILAKVDGADGNTHWVDAPAGGGGGVSVLRAITYLKSIDLEADGYTYNNTDWAGLKNYSIFYDHINDFLVPGVDFSYNIGGGFTVLPDSTRVTSPILANQKLVIHFGVSPTITTPPYTPPEDLPGLVFDANLANPLINLNGNKLSYLPDSTGNYNLSQGDDALRLTYYATGGPNNLPYVLLSSGKTITNSSVPIPMPYSVYMVFKNNTITNGSILGFGAFHNEVAVFAGNTSIVAGAHYSIDNGLIMNSSTWAIVRFRVKAGGFSSTRLNSDGFDLNGDLDSITLGSLPIAALNLGDALGSGAADVSIARLLIFNQNLSDADDNLLFDSLKLDYGIVQNNTCTIFGDSIMGGAGASDGLHGVNHIVCADKGLSEYNFSKPGTSASYLNTVLPTIKIFNPKGYVLFAFGSNDGVVDTAWKLDYKASILTVIKKGVDPNKIIIVSPPYDSVNTYKVGVTALIAEIATELGIKFADYFGWSRDNGGDSLQIGVGQLHPNDAGHAAMAVIIEAQMV